LGGDRLAEQGFVGVFELDDRLFYDQGQEVELLGDFVLAAEGKLEVGMGNQALASISMIKSWRRMGAVIWKATCYTASVRPTFTLLLSLDIAIFNWWMPSS